MTVLIGNDDFPTAIPLVQKSGRWLWDAAEGRYELLLRRVGSNELDAITVCRGFVEAQWAIRRHGPDKTGVRQYAQRIISTTGKRDGLYWPPAAGGPESPVGEAIARAIAQGYTDKTQPYHGYFFKVLTAQGPVGAPRRDGLHGAGSHDRRIRARRLARAVPRHRRQDVHRRQRRHRLRTGPRARTP